jgi:S-adenosylmethionine/arginine decarboxylase-like enzyme
MIQQINPYMLKHIHLLVQGNATDQLTESSLQSLILTIIDKIDMEILGGPFIYRSDVLGNEGLTAITAITTSHIVVHTWDTGLVQIDVYSCKDFNIKDITNILQTMSIVNIKTKLLDRSNGFTDL